MNIVGLGGMYLVILLVEGKGYLFFMIIFFGDMVCVCIFDRRRGGLIMECMWGLVYSLVEDNNSIVIVIEVCYGDFIFFWLFGKLLCLDCISVFVDVIIY